MSMNNPDISIAINSERMAMLQGAHGDIESELSHWETALAAYRRLGDAQMVAQIEPRIASLRAHLAARAA